MTKSKKHRKYYYGRVTAGDMSRLREDLNLLTMADKSVVILNIQHEFNFTSLTKTYTAFYQRRDDDED
jgi:hypothetical protein